MSGQNIKAKTVLSTPAQAENWQGFYGKRQPFLGRYPTEWVVRTLAGGNYPGLKMDKSQYAGARILDMGCGDGRNLSLLLDLGFDVYACEISEELVKSLQMSGETQGWQGISFQTGSNHCLNYPDAFFDHMLCCASCYYLDSNVSWPQVRAELSRVLKPNGLLIANFCDEGNFILSGSDRQEDGSFLIKNDPFDLRNGCRFVAANDESQLRELLSPQFSPLAIGHLSDDFYGIKVSGHIVVARKNKSP